MLEASGHSWSKSQTARSRKVQASKTLHHSPWDTWSQSPHFIKAPPDRIPAAAVPSPPEPFMGPCTQCNAGVGARNKQGSSFPTSASFLDCSALSAALIPSLCCRGTTIHIYDEGDGSPGPWLAEQSTSSPTQAKVLLY